MEESEFSIDLPPLTSEQSQCLQTQFQQQYGGFSEPVVIYDMCQPFMPILACNEAFAQLYGYSLAEMIGFPLNKLKTHDPTHHESAPGDAEYRHYEMSQLRATPSRYCDFLGFSRDGRKFWGECSQHIEEIYKRQVIVEVQHLVNFQRPPTPKMQSASASGEIEEFQRFFRNVTYGVVLVDPHTPRYTVVDCNERYARMLGYMREQVVGHPVANFGADIQDREESYEKWLREAGSSFPEYVKKTGVHVFNGAIQRSDGSIYHVAYMATLITLHDKEYLQIIIRNITHYNLADASLEIIQYVLKLISGDAPLSQLLTAIAQLLEREYSATGVAVLLHRNGQLIHGASPKLPDSYSAEIEAAVSSSTLQYVLQSGECVFIEDTSRVPYKDDPAITAISWARSCWVAPIKSRNQEVLGLIVIYGHNSARPTLNEVELLGVTTNLASVGIEQRQMTDKLEYQAGHDTLTGLPNRLLFQDRLQTALTQAHRRHEQLALLFLDLDGFKQVNDTLGHAAGDLLLQEVARRLQNCVRASDTISRMGGDEFTITLPNIKEAKDAALVADKVLDVLKAPFHVMEHEMFVSASVGIAVFPRDGDDSTTLQRNADAAMYRAKANGKNRFEFFEDEIGQRIQERLELKSQLRRAIEKKEFELFYQPQIELASQKIAGLEALIRWRHPRLGTVLPLSFIPAAEECGVILKIGDWVVNEACRQLAKWQCDGLDLPRVTVNISALQFGQNEFFNSVAEALRRHDVAPQCLELELTESVLMRDVDESARLMKRLKNIGIRIAIDDFGTGYSSLSYLQKLPADVLKIDRSFIQKIDHAQSSRLLVEAIVTLARGLNLHVTAEGVETAGELKILHEIGCDLAQGFYLASPMPGPEVEHFVLTQSFGIS